MLIEAFMKRQSEGYTPEDEEDPRYEEDTPEMMELREKLENQYDKHLEDAAMNGFSVSLATPMGKRYILFKNRCKQEGEAYANADAEKKKKMIADWIKMQYETYQDTGDRHHRLLV